MDLPWDAARTRAELVRTIEATGTASEQRVRITVTRGVGDISPDPDSCTPTVLIFLTPFTPPAPEVYENGVSVIVSSFYRSRQLGDAKTGNLEYLEHTSTQGKTPRNFAIDPTGKLVLAANQESDSAVVFQIDQQSGQLKPSGEVLKVPVPVCVLFVPVA